MVGSMILIGAGRDGMVGSMIGAGRGYGWEYDRSGSGWVWLDGAAGSVKQTLHCKRTTLNVRVLELG